MRNHEELLEVNDSRHNRVNHVKSTRSDGQSIRRNLHSLTLQRNFSRPSLNYEPAELRDNAYQLTKD